MWKDFKTQCNLNPQELYLLSWVSHIYINSSILSYNCKPFWVLCLKYCDIMHSLTNINNQLVNRFVFLSKPRNLQTLHKLHSPINSTSHSIEKGIWYISQTDETCKLLQVTNVLPRIRKDYDTFQQIHILSCSQVIVMMFASLVAYYVAFNTLHTYHVCP